MEAYLYFPKDPDTVCPKKGISPTKYNPIVRMGFFDHHSYEFSARIPGFLGFDFMSLFAD